MSDNVLKIQVFDEVRITDVFGVPNTMNRPQVFPILLDVLVEVAKALSPVQLPRPPTLFLTNLSTSEPSLA